MAKRGRKTKLDQEVAKRITDALLLGGTRRHAAEMAGIAEQTLYNWLAWGEADKSGQYFEFLGAVKAAEAQVEARMLASVQKAAGGHHYKRKRTRYKVIPVQNSDGTPRLDRDGKPLTFIEPEVTEDEGYEFDARIALEWLKRRRRAEWGDTLDLSKLPNDLLIRILEEHLAQGTGASQADPAKSN